MRKQHSKALPVFLLLALCGQASAQHDVITGVTPLTAEATASVGTDAFVPGNFIAADGAALPYRLLSPSHLKAGERYPLVIQFHGSGGIGNDNSGQLDRLARSWAIPEVRERYQAYVLVPQFPIRSANYGPASPSQAAEASPVLHLALRLVRDFIVQHPVDPSRIYATGFSMGGSAAWLAPTLDTTLLAAIVPVSGIAPSSDHAIAYRDLPVLIMHGNADDENPITADRRMFDAIRDAGGQHIRFREYQGLGHQPPADLQPGSWWRDWLFQQRRD